MSLNRALPESHQAVLKTLATTFGKSGHRLYLVGGPVRDAQLGLSTDDLDLATDARPTEIKRVLSDTGPSSIFSIGERFGTIGAFFGKLKVEITTFRSETYTPYSRKPAVDFGQSITGDLSRRDFTINAMAFDLIDEQVVDPFGGQQDLKEGVIRAVGSAQERFGEDPLRLLRAIRFAARLEFQIEEATARAISACAAELDWIPRERILPELNEILLSRRPSWGILELCERGLMARVIPDFLELRGMQEDHYQHKDVFEHSLQVVENCQADPVLRWAALLHDIAKPRTRSVEKGQVHFHRHEIVGRQMGRRILRDLTFSRDDTTRVVRLIELHLRPNAYEPGWTDGAVRRLMREAGDELDRLLQLSRADVTSRRMDRRAAAARRVDELEARIAAIRAVEDVSKIKSPLDGNDLMALFKRTPGPWIKPIKDRLQEMVIDGELAPDDRVRAVEIARSLEQELPGSDSKERAAAGQ